MTLITDTETLRAFCNRQKSAEFITVDTEFMREKTYWPILCVLQIGGPDEEAAIDAQAEGIDLSPAYELFDDPHIMKVFHAARQDLEIFFNLNGRLPEPVFDTQVAAMVCGFGDSVGYEQLISRLTKARVDKSSRFSDWSLRPLSERQIQYALSDVTHLRVAYQKLVNMLEENDRVSWISEEMKTLTAIKTYDVDPMNTWRRIKGRIGRGKTLSVLRELAAWREREARRRDVPRNRVMRDETLAEIANQSPTSAKELGKTRGLNAKTAESSYGDQVLKAIATGVAVPQKDWPVPKDKPDIPRGLGPVMDILKVYLKMVSEDANVASKLLASSADIELIAAYGEKADVPALHGWRREMFGEGSLRLRNGEQSLAIKNQKVVLVDQNPQPPEIKETHQ